MRRSVRDIHRRMQERAANARSAQQIRSLSKSKNIFSDASWSIANLTGGKHGVSGAYYATDPSRKIGEPIKAPSGLANDLIAGNLKQLTAVLRHLERNNATVRSAVEAYKARVVGTGISVLPNTGDPAVDEALLSAWHLQRKHIGAAGESDMEIQRIWCADVCTSGNLLGRIVQIEDRINRGLVPLAIMPLEIEWLAAEPIRDISESHTFCEGVEFDFYGRPASYHMINPVTHSGEVVPAEYIIHGFERRRARQAVGEPVLVAIIERALMDGRLTDAEIQSAVNASTLSTYLKSAYPDGTLADETDTDSDGNDVYITEFPLGAHANLAPGDDIGVIQTSRPNMDVAAFHKELMGSVAAASGGLSRVDFDRDGAAYNFANSKFDQIRSNMATRPFQSWFGPCSVGRYYEAILPYLVLQAGISWPADLKERQRLATYELQPDVPPESDEKSSAQALDLMLKNKVVSRTQWLSKRGGDFREILRELEQEEKALKDAGIVSEVPAAFAATDETDDPDETDAVESSAEGDMDV